MKQLLGKVKNNWDSFVVFSECLNFNRVYGVNKRRSTEEGNNFQKIGCFLQFVGTSLVFGLIQDQFGVNFRNLKVHQRIVWSQLLHFCN